MGAETARVEPGHVDLRIPVQHPLGKVLAAAGALGYAEGGSAAEPEVPQAGRRPQQRRSVRTMGDGAVDDALDAGRLNHWHPLHRPAQPRHQPLQILLEQFALRFPGRQPVRRPSLGLVGLFVDADQPGLLLLAQIGGSVGISHHRDFRIAPLDELRHRAGDQVVMLDVADGRIGAQHPRHLPGVAAGGVDQDFGGDGALFGDHPPLPRRQGVDLQHPIARVDPGASVAGALGHGVAQAGGVRMAVVAGPGPGQNAVEADEGVEPPNLLEVDDLHVEAHVGGDAAHMLKPVQIPLAEGEAHAAAAMPTDELAGQLLQPLVQGDAVLMNLGEVVVANEVGTLAGGMPSGAGGEFALLQQQHIGAALFGKMVEQPHAHDAAPDDDDAGLILHGAPLDFAAKSTAPESSTGQAPLAGATTLQPSPAAAFLIV